jgi:hypothetical protein
MKQTARICEAENELQNNIQIISGFKDLIVIFRTVTTGLQAVKRSARF